MSRMHQTKQGEKGGAMQSYQLVYVMGQTLKARNKFATSRPLQS